MKRLLTLVPLWLMMSACGGGAGGGSGLPTQPTTTITDTFSGTLGQQQYMVHTFTAQAAGNIDITLVSVAPLSTLAIGLGAGTWDGTTCTLVDWNNNARQGAVLQDSTNAAGTYCVMVYDVGNISDSINYVVQVGHP